MTEQSLPPSPDDAHGPVAVAPTPKQRDAFPWLYGLGFLALAAAIFYVWEYPGVPAEAASDASAIQAVQQHLADIDARLARLEQRPVADLGKLNARVDALDGKVGDQTQLAIRMDTLSARIESLSGRDQTGLDANKQQLEALTGRITLVEAKTGSLDAVTKRLNRIARLQEASFALDAGRPVGDLPNAPEALARFAHAAPPTEAKLRLRFVRDEQAALATKQPDESDAPFIDRAWDRAQGLITIRRGEDVVVGSPSATVFNHAQSALDAGDLAEAVSLIGSLKGQPAQAMANWLADAKALLGARSALAAMADQA